MASIPTKQTSSSVTKRQHAPKGDNPTAALPCQRCHGAIGWTHSAMQRCQVGREHKPCFRQPCDTWVCCQCLSATVAWEQRAMANRGPHKNWLIVFRVISACMGSPLGSGRSICPHLTPSHPDSHCQRHHRGDSKDQETKSNGNSWGFKKLQISPSLKSWLKMSWNYTLLSR